MLLPVEPPEIDALFLHRAQEVVGECLIECFVFKFPGYNFCGVGIQPHVGCHTGKDVFRVVHAQRGMEVERKVHIAVVDIFE